MNVRCCYCNIRLDSLRSYCNEVCEQKDNLRCKPITDFDLKYPEPNLNQTKERELLLDICRRKK